MKFRSKKKFIVYYEEYSAFSIYADQIEVEPKFVKFFYKGSEVGSILQIFFHHIEYFNSIFDTDTIYLSKTELLRK